MKYYSSGMQLRLGFSIASHLEPDVFIVDEALSVGDVTFQERCVERMHKLVRQGTTVLYVSHNLSSVESLCDRAILIDNGRPVTQGPTKEVLTHYLAMLQNRRVDLRGLETNAGTVRIASATTHTPDGRETRVFGSHQPIELRLRFECDRPIQRPLVRVTVTDGRPGTLIECSMLDDGDAPAWVGTEWECRLLIGELPLRPRVYQVSVDVSEESGHAELMRTLEVATFQVIAPMRDGLNSVVTAAMAGAIDVPYQWDVRT